MGFQFHHMGFKILNEFLNYIETGNNSCNTTEKRRRNEKEERRKKKKMDEKDGLFRAAVVDGNRYKESKFGKGSDLRDRKKSPDN